MCYFLIPSSHVPTFIHVLCVPSDGFPVRSCFFLNRCHCINVTVIFCDMETLEFLIVSGRLEIYIVHFLILKLSHSSYATLPQGLCNVIHSFEVNTPFAVFFWVIDDHPFSLLRCVEDILDYRLFILLAELHHTSCVTVMQGSFNVFLLFPS